MRTPHARTRIVFGPGQFFRSPPTMLTLGQTRRSDACEALGLEADVPDAGFKYPLPPPPPDPNARLTIADLENLMEAL